MAIAHAVNEDNEQHHVEDAHHAPADPNVAPTHGDVKASFTAGQLAFAWILGAVAIVGGIVAGLTLVNN